MVAVTFTTSGVWLICEPRVYSKSLASGQSDIMGDDVAKQWTQGGVEKKLEWGKRR